MNGRQMPTVLASGMVVRWPLNTINKGRGSRCTQMTKGGDYQWVQLPLGAYTSGRNRQWTRESLDKINNGHENYWA